MTEQIKRFSDFIDLRPQRSANESFEDYKIRRKAGRTLLKQYLKGDIVWQSSVQGTYVRQQQ